MEDTNPPPFPPASFASLVLMLATGALQYLGLVPDPTTEKVEPNLDLAKHAIDILEIVKEKTKGNLSENEAEMLDGLLHDLRLKYIAALEAAKQEPKPPAQEKKGEK